MNFEHQCQILKEKSEQIRKSNEEVLRQVKENLVLSAGQELDLTLMCLHQLKITGEFRSELFHVARTRNEALKRKVDEYEVQQTNGIENEAYPEPDQILKEKLELLRKSKDTHPFFKGTRF